MAQHPLAALMGASSPDDVKRFFGAVYRHRADLSTIDVDGIASKFSVEPEAAVQMIEAGRDVVEDAMYKAGPGASGADLARVTPDRLDARLRTLIGNVLAEALPVWRAAAVESRVALPRLVDFDWRVDVKTASDAVTRMAVPTLLVDFKVEGQPTERGVMPDTHTVNLEMSREALGTMLAGLHRIADTLSQIK
uniref:COMM domain-containing protein n=1 Tax=Bicosoecida sp. CB-2014 TaxID=1486930 RepID=A0A7S1CQ85_9STRA|mmetsp:Transcript_9106/g.32172  ORF Transcript_9106/g.32172 Transcript_9106/m.32172 type:complete len:193 (+) Transcript_9106:176-754(+)